MRSTHQPLTFHSIQSFCNSFIHSFCNSFCNSFFNSFIHSFCNSFIHSFCNSFFNSFIHSPIHSFCNSFIHSLIHSFSFASKPKGVFRKESMMCASSVGLSNSTVKYVWIDVDADAPENQNPVTQNDECEFTELVIAPIEGLSSFLSGFFSSFLFAFPSRCFCL